MTRQIGSLLNGSPVPGNLGSERTTLNPARLDEVVAEATLADEATFVQACRLAKRAQPGWAAVPAPVRGRAIQQLGRLVEDNAEALARIITREIGKPIRESRGEVQEVVDTCTFFLGEGRRLYGMTVPSEMPDKQLFTFRSPVGAAAIVTAGNFPVAVPSWYLVPALLCGNAVVWKPAEYTPATAESFAQLILHAGFPEGAFQLVLADGPTTFAGLERAIEDGVLDKVGFTGSTDVGRRIGELCGRNLQTPCLELGGKNPLVVMPDADLDLAVEGALFSGFGTAGQRCTSLGTVIVHADVHDDFVDRFTKAVTEAPIGDPTADVLYGPMIDARFAERFEGWLGLIRDHHTTYGSTAIGRITRAEPREGFVGDDAEAGLYYHPTIVDGVTARRRPVPDRDVRADRRRRHVRDLRRGDGARERPRLRTLVLDLHDRSAARVPVPRARLGRHGQREQLDERGGGAPAVRRERQERQREPAIGRVGARPVHALAGDELGLLGAPAEGADGRDGHLGRPVVPAARLTQPGGEALAEGDALGDVVGVWLCPDSFAAWLTSC